MKDCLVIIDMQVGFINENTEHLSQKIEDFIKSHNFSSIVGTRYINNENTACYKFEGWKDCMEGTVDVEILPKLLKYCSKVFDKNKYSAWQADFIEYVQQNNFDRLVFIGVNTGCCVLHTAFDAYNDLQDCLIISDLCGSTSGNQSHENALQVLRECITQERVIKAENYKE